MRLYGYHILTHPNRPGRRAVNEDAILAAGELRQGRFSEGGLLSGNDYLFAVSDGLHGTPSAAHASRTLLFQLNAIGQSHADLTPRQKVRRLHEQFIEVAMEDQECEGMACTLVAAEIHGVQCRVYHVGDSRAWHIRDGVAERLTRDHTVLEQMIREAAIVPGEGHRYASIYGMLDNYFMASSFETPPEPDCRELTLEEGDLLLLASDGLSMLDEATLSQCITGDLEVAANAPFNAAVAAGSDDNISLILLSRRAASDVARDAMPI